MDTTGGVQGGVDSRWLTYAELAEIRRVDKPSAVKLAIRRRWPRRKNNHGTMQVCVPAEWLVPFGAGAPRDMPDAIGSDAPDATPPAVPDHTFQAAVASLTAAREEAEKRAHRAEQRADQERFRADELKERLDRVTAEAAEQRLVADHARTEVQQAQDAAKRAETETEALRASVDELRGGQELLAEMQAAELAAAQDGARKAEEAAEALRQAEVARKARGRWARLRAAWRGD